MCAALRVCVCVCAGRSHAMCGCGEGEVFHHRYCITFVLSWWRASGRLVVTSLTVCVRLWNLWLWTTKRPSCYRARSSSGLFSFIDKSRIRCIDQLFGAQILHEYPIMPHCGETVVPAGGGVNISRVEVDSLFLFTFCLRNDLKTELLWIYLSC